MNGLEVHPASSGILIWFLPSLLALFFYGIGQGLVKKWIADVHPARFCLYFVVAKAIVNLWYFTSQEHPLLSDPQGYPFLAMGVLAYVMDGLGWILYFQSIVLGPIAIVGTLSAAYPALTVLFAAMLLGETLTPLQYVGVVGVIAGCIGLAYTPPDANSDGSQLSATAQRITKRWIPLALAALVLWAGAQTLVKYAYGFPDSSEVTLALCNTLGGLLTLGVYGFLRGRQGTHSGMEWVRSFLPMGMMAGGDLGVIVANRFGPISIVTPITGAYPVVTLGFAAVFLKEGITKFQWVCVALILIGMGLATWIV